MKNLVNKFKLYDSEIERNDQGELPNQSDIYLLKNDNNRPSQKSIKKIVNDNEVQQEDEELEQQDEVDKELELEQYEEIEEEEEKDQEQDQEDDTEQINIYNIKNLRVSNYKRNKPTSIAGFVQQKLIKPMNRINKFIYNLQGKIIDSYMTSNQLRLVSDRAFAGNNVEHRQRKMLFSKLKKLGRKGVKKSKTANFKDLDRRYILLRKKAVALRKIIEERLVNAGELIQIKFPIFLPDGVFRITTDIISMIFILFQLIVIPLRLCFDFDFPESLEITQNVIDVFFIVDALLTFNTGYYDKGNLIISRRRIFLNYLTFWFWIDVISVFPYDYIIPEENDQAQFALQSAKILRVLRIVRLVKVLKLLRVVKLRAILQKFEEYLQLSDTISGLLGFLKLVVMIFCIAHYCACILNFISVIDSDKFSELYFHKFELDANQQTDRYIAAIYWAVTTMMIIGYGDIVPMTYNEKIFTIFAMLLASVVFAFIINNIGSVLNQFERGQQTYKEKMITVNNYMKRKHLNKNLRVRIRKYLEYLWNYDIDLLEEENLLSCLSVSLREQVQVDITLKFLKECKVLSSKFSEKFLIELAVFAKEKSYLPEEIIFTEEDDDDKNLYFIVTGCIQMFIKSTFTNLKELEQGQHFGELSFFTGNPRLVSAKSKGFSSIVLIQRDSFLEVLNHHTQDKEMFHFIRDKIVFYKDYSIIGIECYVCEEKGHLSLNCPKVHYIVGKEFFVNYFIQCQVNFRTNFKRRKQRRLYSISNAQEIKDCVYEFQKDIKKVLENRDLHQLDPDYVDVKLIKKYLLVEKVNKQEEDEATHLEDIVPLLITQSKKTLRELNHQQVDLDYQPSKTSILKKYPRVSVAVKRVAMKVVVDIKENKAENQQRRLEERIKNAMSVWENDIDRYKIFSVYFPQNNIENVVNQIEADFQKQRTIQQTKFTQKQTLISELKSLKFQEINNSNNNLNMKENVPSPAPTTTVIPNPSPVAPVKSRVQNLLFRALKSMKFLKPINKQIDEINHEEDQQQEKQEFSTKTQDFKFHKEFIRLKTTTNTILALRRKSRQVNLQKGSNITIQELNQEEQQEQQEKQIQLQQENFNFSSSSSDSENAKEYKIADLDKFLFQGLSKAYDDTFKELQSEDQKKNLQVSDQIAEKIEENINSQDE